MYSSTTIFITANPIVCGVVFLQGEGGGGGGGGVGGITPLENVLPP